MPYANVSLIVVVSFTRTPCCEKMRAPKPHEQYQRFPYSLLSLSRSSKKQTKLYYSRLHVGSKTLNSLSCRFLLRGQLLFFVRQKFGKTILNLSKCTFVKHL